MKTVPISSRKIEALFYMLAWALVFSVPYFSERSSGHIDWNEVRNNWMHVSGYLVL